MVGVVGYAWAMCGRFTLTAPDLAALAKEWAAELDAALAGRWRPRFNVAPGNEHPVLMVSGGCRRLVAATFGMAGEREGQLFINARVESAARRPAFRQAFASRRAAVLADGFFEWEGPPSARRPTWFHLRSGRPMLLAALLGPAPGGGTGFAVLTTGAGPPVRALHDRMPVLLPPALLEAWLSGSPPPLPGPAGEELAARPVSARINSVENDDPDCLAPRQPDRQGNLF